MTRIAIISPDATEEMRRNLAKLDIESLVIPKTDLVAKPLSGHPDIQIFIHKKKIFCHPDISRLFLKKIEPIADVTICSSGLSGKYPADIPYNIASTGKSVFHRLKYTEKSIMDYLKSRDIRMIDVKQGYSKCSTVIVDENRIITPDISIHTAASANGVDSLHVSPGFIALPGYDHGFIGGASGSVDGCLLFTGRISGHPDYKKILEWIEMSGKRVVILSRNRAVDLGSIFIIGQS